MITFPTTPEAFISNQERLIGRKLSENEREAVTAWTEVFNHSYKAGTTRDRAALDKSLTKLVELARQQEADSAVHMFLDASRLWIIAAWEQGAERSTIDGKRIDRVTSCQEPP